MKEKLNKKLNSFINENIIKRKAMFIPILGVSVFMLVGYAAVDKESPIIVSNRIEVAYGEKLDLNVIDITDNHDKRDELIVDIKANNVNVMQLGTYELAVSATEVVMLQVISQQLIMLMVMYHRLLKLIKN